MSSDGITIFHRSYVETEFDEYLFSGFSSAMIAFSKELGDELQIIKMRHQQIIFKEIEDGVLILSVDQDYDHDLVQDNINRLLATHSVESILEGSRLGILQQQNYVLEAEICEVFDLDIELPLEEDVDEVPGKDIFLEVLEELQSLD